MTVFEKFVCTLQLLAAASQDECLSADCFRAAAYETARCFYGGDGASVFGDRGCWVGGTSELRFCVGSTGKCFGGLVGVVGNGLAGCVAAERPVAGSAASVVGSATTSVRSGVANAGLGGVAGGLAGVPSVGTARGPNYARNKASRERARLRRWVVPDPVKEVPFLLSDAERRARESFAVRRDLENRVASRRAEIALGCCETVPSESAAGVRRDMEDRVAARKAELRLASLNDERQVAERALLQRQRVVQWQNEAKAKSQASVNSLQSYDPSSTASEIEFREQAKRLADLEEERNVFLDVLLKRGGSQLALEISREVAALRVGTETEAEYACEAAEYTSGFAV